jgi:hypothetical protein
VRAFAAGSGPAWSGERGAAVKSAMCRTSEALRRNRDGIAGFSVNPIFSVRPGVKPPIFSNRSAIRSAMSRSLPDPGGARKQCQRAICSRVAFSTCSIVGYGSGIESSGGRTRTLKLHNAFVNPTCGANRKFDVWKGRHANGDRENSAARLPFCTQVQKINAGSGGFCG